MTGPEVFWLVCLVIVLLQVWRGWRTGVGRQMAAVVGLVAGWLIGKTQGPAFIARFWRGTHLPAFILVPLASVIVGLAVYLIAILAGKLLFKRACDHSFGPTRLFLGAAGAVVGLFVGLFTVWMLLITIRIAGAIQEAPAPEAAAGSRFTSRLHEPPAADSTEPVFVRIKHSIESGVTGEIVQVTDPFPKELYANLNKIARIAADPRLQVRLLDAPGLRDIAADPKVAALRQDAGVMNALENRDYLSLARNPRLLAVANDPRLGKRLEKVDLTRVLNETVADEKLPPGE